MYFLSFPIIDMIVEATIHTLEWLEEPYTFFDIVSNVFSRKENDFNISGAFLKSVSFGFGNPWKRILFLFPLILNIPVFLLQLPQFMYHTILITNGETSIEIFINGAGKMHARTKGLLYTNYFDFGPKKNWIKFLGLEKGKSFFWNILIPSKYVPLEDGHNWERTEMKCYENLTV